MIACGMPTTPWTWAARVRVRPSSAPRRRPGLGPFRIEVEITSGQRGDLAPPQAYVKPESTALLFAGIKGGPMRRSGFNRLAGWAEAVWSIGVPNLHVHDLRHTGNMIAADSGAGLKDLMTRMGHDNVRAVMIYQHAVRGADKVITAAIDKHLIGHQEPEGKAEDDGPDAMTAVR